MVSHLKGSLDRIGGDESELDSPLIDPKPSDRTVEASLSEELLKLSLRDRSAVEEEIHGVHCMAAEETPEFLIDSLEKFDTELICVKLERERQKRQKNQHRQQQKHKQKQRLQGNETDGNGKGYGDVLRNVVMPGTKDEIIDIGTSTGFEEERDNLDDSGMAYCTKKFGYDYDARRYHHHHHHHHHQQNPIRPRKKKDCYVNMTSVRLRFLRCECFDIPKAVRRFVSYLEFTQHLFGDFIAHRPARFSDFSNGNNNHNETNTINSNINSNQNDEIKCLLQSRLTYLPFRDRAGRRICCAVGHTNFKLHPVLRHKIMMYLDWIVSEDIETQKKGIVIVAWPSGEQSNAVDEDTTHNHHATQGNSNANSNANSNVNSNADSNADSNANSNADSSHTEDIWKRFIRPSLSQRDVWFQKKSFESTPLRIAAIHFCAKNTSIYHILSSFYYFGLDQQLKKRYKAQFGTQIEILYQLQQYGIPADLLPLTHSGAVKTNPHIQWIKSRKRIEDQRERIVVEKSLSHHQQDAAPTSRYGSSNSNSNSNSNAEGNRYNPNVYETTELLGSSNNNKGGGVGVRDDPVVWVECPRSYDVIFRRGNTYAQQHLGNLVYKHLIEKTMKEHFVAETRQEKIDLTWKVVKEIEEVWKGRFLNWDTSWKTFVQITDRREMRNKVARSIKEQARGVRKADVASRTIGTKSGATNYGSSIATPTKRQKMVATTSAATNREGDEKRLSNCLNLCSGRPGVIGSAPGVSNTE